MFEASYGLLELLDAGEEAFGDLAGVGREVHAFLAMKAGGGTAFDRVLELFAACAAGAETGGRLGFGHGNNGTSTLARLVLADGAGDATVHEEAAFAATGLANGGDADGGFVGDRALVFANAATDAKGGIDVRTPEGDVIAIALGDSDLARENGLWGNGTDFLADDARGFHAPWEATAVIVKGCAEADGALGGELAEAGFFLDGNALDGTGGADLAAHRTVEFAEADLVIQDGSPKAFEAGAEEGGLEDVRGADADALVTLDTALEEFLFLDGAGRADDIFVVAAILRARGAAEAEEAEAGERAKERAAGLDGGHGEFVLKGWDELEGDRVLGAVLDAVEADETLALAKLRVGIGSALAVLKAEVAVDAFAGIALDAPEGEGGDRAEESAERADDAAEETGDDDIHPDQQEEHEADDPCADVEVLPDVEGVGKDEIN